jgi:anaerobic selenocysteine-containing dehydrogenase
VALSAFNGLAAAQADVVLPRTLFPEQDGTWVNREGRIQRSRAAVAPPEEARSPRAIAALLAAAAGRPDAIPGSDEDILAEIERSIPAFCRARRAWPSEPAVFLGGEARPPQRAVPIPPAAAGEDEGLAGPCDDVHGWPAAAAIKSLQAVRSR